MSKYNRAEFRAWLETLPPDKPFCTPAMTGEPRCPIATYMGYERMPNGRADGDDPSLVRVIDYKMHWRAFEALPRQIIAIIDELEAA